MLLKKSYDKPRQHIKRVVVVQLLSCVQLFGTPWTAAHQAYLSITISRSLHKLLSVELVMPSNHLLLCCPLLLMPSIFPSIRVFSNELVLCIRWPKHWSFSFSNSPSNDPESSVGKESACDAGDPSQIPGSGKSAGEGIGYPCQYSWAFLVVQLGKSLPAMCETQV